MINYLELEASAIQIYYSLVMLYAEAKMKEKEAEKLINQYFIRERILYFMKIMR